MYVRNYEGIITYELTARRLRKEILPYSRKLENKDC